MSTMEPMTIEEIAWHVKDAFAKPERVESFLLQRALLTWIHAEARARQAYHGWKAALGQDHLDYCCACDMSFEDWLAQVKAEVGWPSQSE